jgi:hypothetical protein
VSATAGEKKPPHAPHLKIHCRTTFSGAKSGLTVLLKSFLFVFGAFSPLRKVGQIASRNNFTSGTQNRPLNTLGSYETMQVKRIKQETVHFNLSRINISVNREEEFCQEDSLF